MVTKSPVLYTEVVGYCRSCGWEWYRSIPGNVVEPISTNCPRCGQAAKARP